MKRILVLANNLSQASFRLRIAALIEPLKRRGFDLRVQLRPQGWLGGLRLRRLLRIAGQYDAVLLQRKFLDPMDARHLRRRARKIFYDIDDALMHHNRKVGLISRWRTQRRFEATARIVDHVAAGNEHLAKIFGDRGCDVTIVPTVVDPMRYEPKIHQPTHAPRLVWIGSHSTLQYLAQQLPVLEEAAKQVAGLRLVIIADCTLHSDVIPIEHVPWTLQAEAQDLRRGDIGIAPTPTDPWTLGKCGFKIVQYMAAGLPVIASPVGANATIVQEGRSGLLPCSDTQWIEAISQLAGNPQLRARFGHVGRKRVEMHFSLDRAADLWSNMLAGD